MNMNTWRDAILASPRKRALPVLSFPAIQLLGITVNDLTSDSARQAEGIVTVARRCDTAAAVYMMDLSVEAEAFGSTVRILGDEVPTIVGAILEEPEDAEALAVPPIGAGRTGQYIEAIRLARPQIIDRPLLAGIIGPYSLAGRLQGMSEIMFNCYDEPDMVKTTLDKATDFLIAYARAFKAAGADGVVVAEPAVGLLSPELAEEFAMPWMKQLIDAVQDESFGVIYHNCGGATVKMLDQLAALGALGYHFGDAVDMSQVCAGMPGSALVLGNVSPAKTIRGGTPESVRAETLAVLEACADYPNFVISSGCDIPPASPWENIDAFFAAVDEFYNR